MNRTKVALTSFCFLAFVFFSCNMYAVLKGYSIDSTSVKSLLAGAFFFAALAFFVSLANLFTHDEPVQQRLVAEQGLWKPAVKQKTTARKPPPLPANSVQPSARQQLPSQPPPSLVREPQASMETQIFAAVSLPPQQKMPAQSVRQTMLGMGARQTPPPPPSHVQAQRASEQAQSCPVVQLPPRKTIQPATASQQTIRSGVDRRTIMGIGS
ncbi:MAG: hypothetical protein WC477_03315 [Patescibacteria group bacterium]